MIRCQRCNEKIEDLLDEDMLIETINCKFILCLNCQLDLENWVCNIKNEFKM